MPDFIDNSEPIYIFHYLIFVDRTFGLIFFCSSIPVFFSSIFYFCQIANLFFLFFANMFSKNEHDTFESGPSREIHSFMNKNMNFTWNTTESQNKARESKANCKVPKKHERRALNYKSTIPYFYTKNSTTIILLLPLIHLIHTA